MAAEFHYIPKYLKPFTKGFLYKKEPEMIVDFPQNIYAEKSIPLVFITNHSNRYPIKNIEIDAVICSNSDREILRTKFTISSISSKSVTAHIFYIECNDLINNSVHTKFFIKTLVKYSVNATQKSFNFSNILGCSPKKLEVNLFKRKFFDVEGFSTGDMHIHSSISNDQVEFGYPFEVYKEISRFTNLNFLSITDHSYDIDKKEGHWHKKDDTIEQWKKSVNLCKDSDELEVICGEEVSCGNSKSKNIHVLSIGNREYIHGNGDSGEVLFKNKPDNFLDEMLKKHEDKTGFFAASHPLAKVSFAEKLLLNRDKYSDSDLEKLTHFQFVNSNPWVNYKRELSVYDRLMLKFGKKHLIAGNDAHGYLGWCPQIKVPLIKASYNFSNIFSKNRTVVFRREGESTLDALKKGNCAVTTGNYVVYIKNAKNNTATILIQNNNAIIVENLRLTVKFFVDNKSFEEKKISVNNDFILTPVFNIELKSQQKFKFCYCVIEPEKSKEIAVSNCSCSN